jgi:hypothetical protein
MEPDAGDARKGIHLADVIVESGVLLIADPGWCVREEGLERIVIDLSTD